jgi:predicted metal-dependent hydrolase
VAKREPARRAVHRSHVATKARHSLLAAEQETVITQLRRDGERLALVFALELRSIDAESARVKRRYGICYDDGSIRIRLRHIKTGRLLKYSALVDTLCHELAHLRHFNHGPRFKAFYLQILARARREGIYRPAPRFVKPEMRSLLDFPRRSGDPGRTEPRARPPEPRPRPPEQLSLF